MPHSGAASERGGLVRPRPRILFVGEDVSLAHVGRPIVLALALEEIGYEVVLATGERYRRFVESEGLPYESIETMPAAEFQRRLRSGLPVHTRERLQRQVVEDLSLISRFSPDMVVGDFRVSLGIAAELAGVPYAAISNAYWSAGYGRAFPIPDHPGVRLFGMTAARMMLPLVRSATFLAGVRPFNALRKVYGLREVKGLREMYTQADWTLFADTPSLSPIDPLPKSHSYIGPILWEPRVDKPDWWHEIPEDRPLIYVTAGSSGDTGITTTALRALAGLPVTVAVSWAGAEPPPNLPANVFGAPYLPGSAITERATLVISNGGSPTSYQALALGVPVLGVPSNADQHLAMQGVEAAGAGVSIRSDQLSAPVLTHTVEHMLADGSFERAARSCAQDMEGFDARQRFRSFMEDRFAFLGESPSTASRVA